MRYVTGNANLRTLKTEDNFSTPQQRETQPLPA